jgi:hypothetical protein
MISYVRRSLRVFKTWMLRAQADWTLTHTSHKDTEQSTIEDCITFDGVTLTDWMIRWSPNERTLMSADKMFWTPNKPAKWASYNNVKLSLCLINQAQCREDIRRSGRISPWFLVSTLDGGECSASRPDRLTPGERAPGIYWIGGWVDLRAGLDDLEKRKFLTLLGLELWPLGCPARG